MNDTTRDALEAKGYRLIRAAVLAGGDLPGWLDEALCVPDTAEDFDALVLGTANASALSAQPAASVSREAFENALRAMRWSNSIFATSDARAFLECLGITITE